MNKPGSSKGASMTQMKNDCRRSIMLATVCAITGALVPTWVAAQAALSPSGAPADQAPAQDLSNPANTGLMNRNPDRRSGVFDSAPVAQDPRNSSSRPTLPAAPGTTDSRDAVLPPPDRTRDAAPMLSGETASDKPQAN